MQAHPMAGTATAPSVIVVGAGIVGMAVALMLQAEGRRVTVYDPRAPGTACSAGNSGGFGIGLVAPIAMPGIVKAAPRLLLDPDEPLFIDPRILPRAVPWFWRFARNSRPDAVRRIAAARAALNHCVRETLDRLVELAGAQRLVRHQGMTFLFGGDRLPGGAEQRFALARAHGIETVALAPDEIAARYPAVASRIRLGVHIPQNLHCTDPLGLVTACAAAFLGRGGRILRAAVEGLVPGLPPAIRVGGETLAADEVVVAAGVWSRALVRPLGCRIPLEAERGYHLMLPRPGIALPAPTTLADRNVVLTPMDRGLRITGVAEFAPVDAPPRFERAFRLLRQAQAYFPALDGTGAEPWMGPRPSTPDSLPVIGPAPGRPGIWFAFGHGQSGLAHASVTGRILADLIARRPPPIDLRPYAPDRF
jgi:D-amino-acid dehydrogenase